MRLFLRLLVFGAILCAVRAVIESFKMPPAAIAPPATQADVETATLLGGSWYVDGNGAPRVRMPSRWRVRLRLRLGRLGTERQPRSTRFDPRWLRGQSTVEPKQAAAPSRRSTSALRPVLAIVVMLALCASAALVNPFVSDGKIRTHVRRTAVKIAASAVALGAGEIMADEHGNIYGGDGITAQSSLSRLMRYIEGTLDSTLAIDATKGPNALALGGADDTANLTALANAAVAANLPLRPPPTTVYVGNWAPPSGLRMVAAGSGRTTLKMHPSYSGANVRTIDVSNTSNVELENVTVDGSLSSFSGVSTEQKHGIYATNVTRLRLRSVRITNCKGDGLYIGKGTGHSTGVTVFDLRCDANWRNNLTIADLADGKFFGCNFDLATGTNPQAGLDIEPNDNTYVVSDVRFMGCTFNGSTGYGIANTFYPGGQVQKRIRFVACTVSGNGTGVYLYGSYGLSFTDCDITGSTLDNVAFQSGAINDISFRGGYITLAGHHGINCQPTTGSTVKNVKLIGVTILDNGTATANTYYGMLWDVTGSAAGAVDRITLIGVTSSNRDTANQKYPAYFSAAVSNLTVEGCDLSNNVSGPAFNDDSTTRRRSNNVGISDDVSVTGNLTLPSTARAAACTVTAATTLTLPPNPEVARPYLIYDGAGNVATFNVTIVPSAGHSWALGSNAVLNTNGQLVVCYYRANRWYR